MGKQKTMLNNLIALLKRLPIFLPVRNILFSFYKLPSFIKNYHSFKRLNSKKRFEVKLLDLYPCLCDNTPTTGFDPHYLYHISWATRCVKKINPAKHIDFSSHVYFSSLLSAFIPVDFYDYRPANIILSGLETKGANLINLPFSDNSLSSISCMHVVEHIGLGRYGDPINPEADLKAIQELIRVLAYEGNLLFVVPIGKPRLMFNGHRIYSYNQILEYFSELLLREFAIIPDNWQNGIEYKPSKEFVDSQSYACGLFWWTKKG